MLVDGQRENGRLLYKDKDVNCLITIKTNQANRQATKPNSRNKSLLVAPIYFLPEVDILLRKENISGAIT
ncbi:hypothetical protein AXFE_30150 [Acidithrix ferrooxidans]|jgi:hypothetical protein|uniref:Uncharacterized protein n=1 Tax=Acidithrix ferrooxidans TaxID=1280514 RepID=A0A0D8HDX6_9ACTN|nr:hypothetical protein AXFE_30150 [Acidithrix ferrooxidans]